MPLVPGAGTPKIRARPLPRSENDRPTGRLPESVIVGVGAPDAEIVKLDEIPGETSIEDALVIAGAWVGATVIVRVCFALVAEPFEAVSDAVYVDALFAAGVPEIVAEPLEAAAKLMPGGRVPLSEITGAGEPLAVIEKLV